MIWEFIIGLFIGGLLNALWYHVWVRVDRKHLGKYRWRYLSWFEHYHWSTILYMIWFEFDYSLFGGIATMLLIDESVAQNHKFAIGSNHFLQSLIIELIIIIGWLLYRLHKFCCPFT